MVRIKEVAKEKGISVGELAEKLEISKVAISKIINGSPSLSSLLRIAKILDVDVRELIMPTKESHLTEIYIKENDVYKSVGFFDLGKLKGE